MAIFLLLYVSFFQIGLFGIGGDPAAQALLEHELITHNHWMTPEMMANLMAFSRMMPGCTALNAASLTSAMVAAKAFGFWGSAAASLTAVISLCLPAALWTAVYEKFAHAAGYRVYLDHAMVFLRPLIPGLIAAAALLMMRADNFANPTTHPWDFWVTVFLFISTLIGVGMYRFNALFMIILCGLAGWILL